MRRTPPTLRSPLFQPPETASLQPPSGVELDAPALDASLDPPSLDELSLDPASLEAASLDG